MVGYPLPRGWGSARQSVKEHRIQRVKLPSHFCHTVILASPSTRSMAVNWTGDSDSLGMVLRWGMLVSRCYGGHSDEQCRRTALPLQMPARSGEDASATGDRGGGKGEIGEF